MADEEHGPALILMAEDDPDDRTLIQEAIEESTFDIKLVCVADGEELMAYLRHQAPHQSSADAPPPQLILLDLNMPRKDGRQALLEIKADPALRQLPVLVLTTSSSPEDIQLCYERGANSVSTKPSTFGDLVDLVETIGSYWFRFAQLPSQGPETS